MAKRLTDTDKWKKGFLRALDAPYKLLWLYILDECDMAGIWHVDMEVARIKIGADVTAPMALLMFGDRITAFDDGKKWFVKDFIAFQYGELKPANRMHSAVIATLKRTYPEYEQGRSKGLPSPQIQEYIQEQKQGEEQKQIHDVAQKTFLWFQCCIDEVYMETLKITHIGKNIPLAMKEAYAHLVSEPARHAAAEQGDVKKLVNTWLTNQKKDARSTNEGTINGVKQFSGSGYGKR